MICEIKIYALVCVLFLLSNSLLTSQEVDSTYRLPYFEIGDYPQHNTASSIVVRLLDGLGYRYYWATQDLRADDLSYKPSEDGRTTLETLKHIHSLTRAIYLFSVNREIERSTSQDSMDWEQLRSETLVNIKNASNSLLGMSESELFDLKVTFRRGENVSTFEFWHMINGPISDALYHVGQIVSNRRSSGNPLDARVNVFTGINR